MAECTGRACILETGVVRAGIPPAPDSGTEEENRPLLSDKQTLAVGIQVLQDMPRSRCLERRALGAPGLSKCALGSGPLQPTSLLALEKKKKNTNCSG